MIYKFRKDLENDDYAYTVMTDKLNELLNEAGIPTRAGENFRSRTGLIALKPYPWKGFASETKKLMKMPWISRVKKGRMFLEDGNLIIVISAHCNGIEMLKQTMNPEDEIVFYEYENSKKEEEGEKRIDLSK